MEKYKNTSVNKIIISGSAGALTEIMPGQIIELDANIARRGFPYLQKVNEVNPQILVEAPLPLEPVKETPKQEFKKKKKKKFNQTSGESNG